MRRQDAIVAVATAAVAAAAALRWGRGRAREGLRVVAAAVVARLAWRASLLEVGRWAGSVGSVGRVGAGGAAGWVQVAPPVRSVVVWRVVFRHY